jgi:hypothetical protein
MTTSLTGKPHACRISPLNITRVTAELAWAPPAKNIRFINSSTAACELHGWPTLIAESAGGPHAHVSGRRDAAAAVERGAVFGRCSAASLTTMGTYVPIVSFVDRTGEHGDALTCEWIEAWLSSCARRSYV